MDAQHNALLPRTRATLTRRPRGKLRAVWDLRCVSILGERCLVFTEVLDTAL
jgi:hypothetical protein